MRVRFRATNGEFDANDYSLICGVDGRDANGIEHALSFDRLSELAATENPSDDWGVHAQFDDQSNGGYGAVARCHLTRMSLCVDLSRQLGRLIGVDGFDVELAIGNQAFEAVKGGLIRIFRDMPIVLVLN